MNVQMTYNKILVKPMADAEVSRGGIILPPSVTKEQTLVGIVHGVGPGRVSDQGALIPCCVQIGDKILYSRHQGFPIEIDREKYTVMPDVEALMIFPKDEPAQEPKKEGSNG